LRPGLVLAVGPNGVGKTNLLEALHVGTQGFSPRTRTDAQLIRFGARTARIGVRGVRATVPIEIELILETGAGKRAKMNGAALRAADQLRAETATLVFTPDRLGVVKGAPAARRAYFDRALGRLSPAKAQLSVEYGAAVAQRNASLRRVAGGFSTREALAPWTEQVVELGTQLVAARKEVLALLAPPFAERAGELGLPDAELRYDGQPLSAAALEERLDRDLERGITGVGPHLDDVVVASDARELRSFGSQGEQRLAVLALLLAEAELIVDRRGVPPLLLLDDVLSELDPERRRILAARVATAGQALITATDAAMLPAEPDQLLEVTHGEVHDRAAR
jgi:DNA replication and repair protein RecF